MGATRQAVAVFAKWMHVLETALDLWAEWIFFENAEIFMGNGVPSNAQWIPFELLSNENPIEYLLRYIISFLSLPIIQIDIFLPLSIKTDVEPLKILSQKFKFVQMCSRSPKRHFSLERIGCNLDCFLISPMRVIESAIKIFWSPPKSFFVSVRRTSSRILALY